MGLILSVLKRKTIDIKTSVKQRRQCSSSQRYRLRTAVCITAVMLFVVLPGCIPSSETSLQNRDGSTVFILPEPVYDGNLSIEAALYHRRSIRQYSVEPLSLHQISQLLWSAQGITDPKGLRTAPSAGALYPLEFYIVNGNIQGLDQGIYRYEPDGHRLVRISDGDKRAGLAAAALQQGCVKEAAVDIVITAVYNRTTQKYGERGIRYIHIEAGHAAQNICLQAVALELGTVTIGAFHDSQVSDLLELSQGEHPLYIMPVGRLRKN